MRDGWQPPDDLPKVGDPANEDPRNVRIVELESTLRAIVRQCEVADDPEHMTLGLVKNIAKQAIEGGQFMGVRVAHPAVPPTGTSVEAIRAAVQSLPKPTKE